MNDELTVCLNKLLEVIKGSKEYIEYKKQEELLAANPDLQQRVDKLRADNFRLQNDPSADLIVRAGSLASEFAELRKDPAANAYLDAELAFCRQVQKVTRVLIDSIDIRIPDIGD